MIARVWKGTVRAEDGDAFAAVILDTGFSAYTSARGNRGAWLLRHDHETTTEFVTFSLWDSREAIRAFAGDDMDQAVTYPEDDLYLVEPRPVVTHFEVAGSHLPT